MNNYQEKSEIFMISSLIIFKYINLGIFEISQIFPKFIVDNINEIVDSSFHTILSKLLPKYSEKYWHFRYRLMLWSTVKMLCFIISLGKITIKIIKIK